jgi:hypothetical protein
LSTVVTIAADQPQHAKVATVNTQKPGIAIAFIAIIFVGAFIALLAACMPCPSNNKEEGLNLTGSRERVLVRLRMRREV